MQAFCAKNALDIVCVAFGYNGQHVHKENSALEIGLSANDIIYAYIKPKEEQICALLQEDDLTTSTALWLLMESNYAGYLPNGQINVFDAERLLSKTNVNELSKIMKSMYYMLCCSISIFGHLSFSKPTICAQQMMKQLMLCSDEEIRSMTGFRDTAIPLTLYRVGLYEESLRLMRRANVYSELMPLNTFHIGKWQETIDECYRYQPFRDESAEFITKDNAVCGLEIYATIKRRRYRDARKLLRQYAQQKNFRNNLIITYCARELKQKQYLTIDYQMKEWDLDIFYLFQGMIYQFQMKRYLKAILIYHQCNFHAVHPIHYDRLFLGGI